MNKDLQDLEKKSIAVIREAKAQFRNPAVLWSTGKDSTTTVWLCKKAFFGELPFPVIHIDTGYKFPAIYAFRDQVAKEWGLNLIIAKNEDALAQGQTGVLHRAKNRRPQKLNNPTQVRRALSRH
jgi:sulfate adenylyltransferase subunit 2